jgi:hypothetical protein
MLKNKITRYGCTADGLATPYECMLMRLFPRETAKKWAISPDSSDEIAPLEFETEFGLLVDLSGDPSANSNND